MLNQLIVDAFSFLLTYLPRILSLIFSIILLVFAIFIYKRNSYKYGITLMISSIISLISNTIYVAIQFPFLAYRLNVELGLTYMEITIILMFISLVFLSLDTSSTVLFVVSVYLIYKTHKKDRIE